MSYNPNSVSNKYNGTLVSKRSRTYCKMYPVKKRPRRKPCTHFDRPLMLDSSKLIDRMFAKLFDLDWSKLAQWEHKWVARGPFCTQRYNLCTEYFVYDKYKTQAMVDMYNKL